MPRQRVWVHLLLFALTVVSTVLVGGPAFSAALLSILTAHEFGHYFTAKWHRVPASLPYFLPLPLPPFGTLGAVIRMSARIPHRRALFDIAAAGPIAGLVLALPLSYVGILASEIVRTDGLPENVVSLGEPLLFQGLAWLAHGSLSPDVDLLLHPLAYAGWAGMFVTALNLLPIGQLDGGHITHALFGSRSRQVAFVIFAGLAAYTLIPIVGRLLVALLPGLFGGLAQYELIRRQPTWILLLALLWFFGLRHPPTEDETLPLGFRRQAIGALLMVIFVLCFSLDPFRE
jgi:membrane-associated protease RseP (regulator of RpoE activity)